MPRKRFGQHFLVDPSVVARIVAAIDPRPGEALVEIGPGLGALTNPLAAAAGVLTVIELDRDLAARLRRRSELHVIEADVLGVDFADPALVHPAVSPNAGGLLRVAGNLPYNISSPILFRLLGAAGHVADQHLMLQKEVVDRMVAPPGGKVYGRLSVMLQWRYRMEALFDVPPEAFDPPPRVESAVVRMTPHPTPPAIDRRLLETVVATAFSQRRKLLRHTLGRWIAERGLETGFDLQRRAEEVAVAEYVALAIEAEKNRPA